MPPVLYIFSVISIERHLNDRYANEIEDIYVGDTHPLFNGSVKLKDAINKNIDRYLQSKVLVAWGIKANVTVTTKRGSILYPAVLKTRKVLLSRWIPCKLQPLITTL